MTPNLLDELEACPFCGHAGPFDQWPCEWLDATETNVIRCPMCHGAAPAARWNKRTHAHALADMAKRLEAAERDSKRLDWLEGQREAYGFENCHEGNRWVIDGPFATARQAIDATQEGAG